MWTQSFAGSLRRRAALVVIAGSCLLGACGETTHSFRPAVPSDRAGATYSATSYRVVVGPNDLGKATLWTEGPGKDRVIDVRVRLKNETSAPMTLDVSKSRLAITTRGGETVVVTTPAKVGAGSSVAPASSSAVQLGYELPATVATNDVTGYRLDWLLKTPQGDFSQATQFVREPPRDHYGTCPDFYGRIGYCSGWEQEQWMGYDNPSDPAMPQYGGVH